MTILEILGSMVGAVLVLAAVAYVRRFRETKGTDSNSLSTKTFARKRC
jgi:hypothetical protein